jgi:recombination protein RecA
MNAGKVDMDVYRKLLNKKVGMTVAHNLNKENPTEVKEWIPTGSRWLDSIICRGQLAGIPVGKITEIAGLEASGKSFMAAQIAGNAQKMGIRVAYFDAESAIDPTFLAKAGCNVDDLLYVQAASVEKVFEMIETLLADEEKWLFIWDSLAHTPAEKDVEGDFNPQSSMAMKARILSKAFSKVTIPLANTQSTFLIVNQLKTNITSNIAEALTTPYFTPGGKAAHYTYSLRIWLTARKAKAAYILDSNGVRIGSEVKVKLEKSRFGSAGRTCNFKLLWGQQVGIQDEESWLDAIKGSERLKTGGAWYTLTSKEGREFKFQGKQWVEKLQDPEFRQVIFDVMDEHVIYKPAEDNEDALQTQED